jgi:hypothetical protein
MPRFAEWWDEQVKANELLDIDERKCLFRKTADMLQDHYLKSKRYANAVATMNQVSTQGTSSVMDQCKSLQARFRNAGVGEQYSEVSNVQPPRVPARNADGTNSSTKVGIVPVELVGANSEVRARAQTYDHVNATQIPFPLPNEKQGKKRQMCKRCGQERSGSHHNTNAFTKSKAYCTVPEQDRTPGHEVPHYYRVGDPRKPPQQKRKC